MDWRTATRRLLSGLIIVIAGGSGAAAQDCIDYGDYLHWASCQADLDKAIGLTFDDGYLYVGAGQDGLVVVDVSDPTNPVRRGTAITPWWACDSIVLGNYAYVADGPTASFAVVDISDPDNPVVTGSDAAGSGDAWELALVAPDTVWVADRQYGVRVVDISDPYAPDIVSGFLPGGWPYEIDAHDGRAYLADDFGFRIFDLSEGAARPDQIGFIHDPAFNIGLTRNGDYYYVHGYDSLSVVDASIPDAPVLLNKFATTGPGYGMDISGSRGYVAQAGNTNHRRGLQIFDLTDPTAPVMEDSLSTQNQCIDIEVVGKYAFVTCDFQGLLIADVSNPVSAPWASWLGPDHPVAPIPIAFEVATQGDLAFVAGSSSGLKVVDVSSPDAPAIIGEYTGSWPLDVQIQGDYAYICSANPALEIISIVDPTNPVMVGTINPLGTADAITVHGDWVYVAAQSRGLQIIEVTDPSTPVQRGEMALPGTPFGLHATGGYLYMACDRAGLQIADLTDPESPAIVASLPMADQAWNVLVVDGIAYVSGYDEGLHIVDVSNPLAPVLLSTLHTPGMVRDVVVDGDLVYIADDDGGMQIGNVSDPTDPRMVGSRDTNIHAAIAVAVADGAVLVADHTGGLAVAWKQCETGTSAPEVPGVTRLDLLARPNPFNARTELVYEAPPGSRLDLRIYDLAGRLVRKLLADHSDDDGRGSVVWDGRDDAGASVAAGAYLCVLEAGDQRTTTKAMLIK